MPSLLNRALWKLMLGKNQRQRCLRLAVKEQKLDSLVERLETLVPDISQQYTTHQLVDPYVVFKARALQAFQMQMVLAAVDRLGPPETVVDIGDSSGTHLRYLSGLLDRQPRTVSVNLDAKAIERIRAHGMEAYCMRAEELAAKGIEADFGLCFETLEHFTDPISFLYSLSHQQPPKALIVTVPFVSPSRVGLHHIRHQRAEPVSAERCHIFELSPEDWRLLFQHSGWTVLHDRIFYQYPRRHPFRLTRNWWREADFEGFYGLIASPNHIWSDRYMDWPATDTSNQAASP